MKKNLIAIAFLFFLIIDVAFYMGFFNRIKVEEKEIGPLVLIFNTYVGDYKKTAIIRDQIFSSIKSQNKIKATKTFSIYYDSQGVVPTDKLRSDNGVILDEQYWKDGETLSMLYDFKKIDKQIALTAEFPLRNIFSDLFGTIKVYPALEEYAKEKNYQGDRTMEIYDKVSKKIIYIMFLKQ